jgi:dTDP-4-amino-4,6-dideoxygalactose transaminase
MYMSTNPSKATPFVSATPTRKVRFVEPVKNYQSIKGEIDAAYADVMNGGDYIDRRHLKSFEENLAKFVGTKYAVGLNSGYDSLHLSLRALGIGPGDEVIVPAHTFVATASAVVNAGATPVLVDVRPDFNINPELIEKAITKKTKALLPVHLNGRTAEMDRVLEIAKDHDLKVVEDACQSLGARFNKKGAGSMGDAGCWSFYPFKILGGYGDGGAITTNDPEIAQFARRMRFNGEDRGTGEYHGHGFTCLLDNLQAAFLDVKLRHLPAWIERRRKVAKAYFDGFSTLTGIALPHFEDKRFSDVYQNYVVRATSGDAFSNGLKAAGVEVLVQFRKPYYRHAALKLKDRGFPETEKLSKEVCSLPMNPEISDHDVQYVIETSSRLLSSQKGRRQ